MAGGKLELSDAADRASDQEIQTDVCFVGAAPDGTSIAHDLRGTDVSRRSGRLVG
jgi:hypothetical protein